MADKKELTLKGFGIAQGIIEKLKNPQTFTATATGMELSASPMGAIAWCNIVAKQIGHNMTGLVEHYDQHLMDLRLILERTYSDKSGISKGEHFRLADLGYKLCEFISNFQDVNEINDN